MTWLIWVVIAIVFIILEVSTPSMLFFTCLSVGALFGAACAYFNVSNTLQVLVFAIVSIVSIFTIRPIFKTWFKKFDLVKTNVDALIGQEAVVTEKITPFKDGFVKVSGEVWLAQASGDIEIGQVVQVQSVSGTKVKVEKI